MSRPSLVHTVPPPPNGSPPPTVESLTVPCRHCGDARACLAALHDLVRIDEHLGFVGSPQGWDGIHPLREASVAIHCFACRNKGRVLTPEGLQLLSLLPPDVIAAALEAAKDADVPF